MFIIFNYQVKANDQCKSESGSCIFGISQDILPSTSFCKEYAIRFMSFRNTKNSKYLFLCIPVNDIFIILFRNIMKIIVIGKEKICLSWLIKVYLMHFNQKLMNFLVPDKIFSNSIFKN